MWGPKDRALRGFKQREPQGTTGLGVLKLRDRVGRKSGDKEFK